MSNYHVLNLGAGVQSTKLALAFDAGEVIGDDGDPVKLDCAYFADTQDEPRKVYDHLQWLIRTIKNYPIHVRTKGRLSDHLRTGQNSTGQRFATIPAFTLAPDGKAGKMRRQCSSEYKINVIETAIKRELLGMVPRQRVPKNVQVTQYLGISMDEAGRAVRVMKNFVPKNMRETVDSWNYGRLIEWYASRNWRFGFPLVDGFETRAHCVEYLKPRVPHKTPRSACVYCPFHDDPEWAAVREDPEDWALAVDVDRSLRVPGNVVNRKLDQPLYLHRSCMPLDLVQLDLTPRKFQTSLNFAAECLGVCGL